MDSSLVLILMFLVIMGIPCTGVAILGTKMINKLGNFPSKTPAIQLSVFWKLLIIEVVGFTMLIGFYHLFADYSGELKKEKMKLSEQN